MTPDHQLLAQLLTLTALLAVTIQYCEVIKRREVRRQRMAERTASEAAGLEGLVRVFLTER